MFTIAINITVGILLIWVLILSFLNFKSYRHYQKLTSTSKKGTIDTILDKLIDNDIKLEKVTEQIRKELAKIEITSQHYFQKLGIIRFNPFERVGGEQSFVLALLNRENNGVVINFIYTREGVRVYSKQVAKGKGVEYDLSQEEKEAIKKSQEAVSIIRS